MGVPLAGRWGCSARSTPFVDEQCMEISWYIDLAFTVGSGMGAHRPPASAKSEKDSDWNFRAETGGSRSCTQTYQMTRSLVTRVGYVVILRWLCNIKPNIIGDRKITQGSQDRLEVATPIWDFYPAPISRLRSELSISTRDHDPDLEHRSRSETSIPIIYCDPGISCVRVGCGLRQGSWETALGISYIGTRGWSSGEGDAWPQKSWYR